MKDSTKQKLKEAMEWCDANDKSTEFMIEYMHDVAGASHECVMNYLTTYGGFKEVTKNNN